MEVFDRFAAAFNARDLDALADCLADDAVARVDGAPFPEEKGRDVIRKTSLPHLLEGSELRAVRSDTMQGWILLRDAAGRLDCAVEVTECDGRIAALRYVTAPHRPEELRSLADRAGMP